MKPIIKDKKGNKWVILTTIDSNILLGNAKTKELKVISILTINNYEYSPCEE